MFNNDDTRTIQTLTAFQDPTGTIYADSQGTFQRLPHSYNFIAYGQIAKFKEYNNANKNVIIRA
ncbi:MAG: hypothetical protein Q9171_006406 [Xanthocarpia ochracea]